ncbi:MAG TPA: hypothetical protein PLQ35_18160 [bacterium]|nr:hypothetical protein [bacterium]
MYKSLFSFFVVFVLLPVTQSTPAEESIPEWWATHIHVQRIGLPDDRYCPNGQLIAMLANSGLAINVVLRLPIIGEELIIQEHVIDGVTSEIDVIQPRKTPWKAFSVEPTTTPLAGNVIQHYCSEAGQYGVYFVNKMPVIIDNADLKAFEETQFPSYSRTGVVLAEVVSHYSDQLGKNGIVFIIQMLGMRGKDTISYPSDVKVDFDFKGGNMLEMLCAVNASVNAADPSHVCYWFISGPKAPRILTYGAVGREKFDRLFVK